MSEHRAGCCADWPKPCSYHEGYQDALDETEARAEAAEASLAEALAECDAAVALLTRVAAVLSEWDNEPITQPALGEARAFLAALDG